MKKIYHCLLCSCLSLYVLLPIKINAAVGKVTCGNNNQGLTGEYAVPKKFPELTSYAITVIQVAVPVVIIILGMIDLIKAITAGKEDEIKKAQGIIIRRLITGALVFFVFAIVKLLVSIVDNNSTGIIDCMNCFVNNSCKVVK